MKRRGAAAFAFGSLCLALALAPARAVHAVAPAARDDYANARFTAALTGGLRHFYARDFSASQRDFESALRAVPENTLAIAFLNASAAHRPGALDGLTNLEENAVLRAPGDYRSHLRLAFSYLFASQSGRDRSQDARDELHAAAALRPAAPAVHDGLGVQRFGERSANRAKGEFVTALAADPNDVLAREYLAQLYQTDLHDPQRGLSYAIDVPNLVPQYADIDFHIGSLLHDLRQPELAVEYLKRGIALDSGHVGEAGQHGYTLLARIEIEQHRLSEATQTLNAAIAGDVDSVYARTLLAKIKSGDYAATPSPVPETNH